MVLEVASSMTDCCSSNGATEAPVPLETGHMMINDVNIGYCRYGSGPNFLLCICGAVGCYAKDFPETLIRHFDPTLMTIVCIDPPGYGTSRPPDRKQEIMRCTKDSEFCVKLMQGLNLVPFTVCGWSEGARTAVDVAARGPTIAHKMILMAAGTRVNAMGANAFRGMRNTDQWLPTARAPYLKHYDEAFLRKQWADLCDVVVEVYEMMGGRFPCDHKLVQITQPSLIVNGGQDRFCADPKTNFLNVLKNARLETQFHGGHDFHIKYPKWFADKVQAFIKEK
ncbi:hypothetical protein PFISCL1PPCAC_7078 [Pristionchus fissidentatus]|uniref:AB hydrolase-1 domain-containing protein n=1 Tax=Pristionchus fissidentatus TaxID=1538716 RepID=A0AAV5V810_9BILA|nr:hypothetical protein PFISCL1PPCAC_7078 [Pristionchus fissidentatus]